MSTELVIYSDESEKQGKYFSNFYGGLLVKSADLKRAIDTLSDIKLREGLHNEVKWQRVSKQYLGKYVALVNGLFDLVDNDVIKIRIMFTSNQYVPTGLTKEQRQTVYQRLYYQFIKHAFGLRYCSQDCTPPVRIRLNLDQLPTSKEASLRFKAYVAALNQYPAFRQANVRVDHAQIAEVDSRKHVLMQCLDIVLGAMAFRLNDKHKEKAPGQTRRGSRTIAKENLYKQISQRIRVTYPNFNIGISTGIQGDRSNRWRHRYRHWLFVPTDHQRDFEKAKP